MKKLKQYYKKIITYVRKKENYGKVLLGVLVLIFLVFTAIYILGTRNISKIEERKIINNSRNYMNFIEDITESKSKDIDKYVIFALDYNLYNNNKNEIATGDLVKFINDTFLLNITKDKIISLGITEEMLNKRITYNSGKDTYSIKKDESTKEIKEKNFIYYKVKKIRRKNKNTYVIKYSKYLIDDPYKILNYYIEKNTNLEPKNQKDIVDIKPIRNYLVGNTSISSVKKLISYNEDDLKNYSKKKGSVKIIYVIEGNNIKIKKIK